ncbi:hypothetical protein Ancab_033145 [Ancistrocladus abbreviatus]
MDSHLIPCQLIEPKRSNWRLKHSLLYFQVDAFHFILIDTFFPSPHHRFRSKIRRTSCIGVCVSFKLNTFTINYQFQELVFCLRTKLFCKQGSFQSSRHSTGTSILQSRIRMLHFLSNHTTSQLISHPPPAHPSFPNSITFQEERKKTTQFSFYGDRLRS